MEVQVATADTGGTHPDKHLAGSRHGAWHFFESDVFGTVQDECPHRGWNGHGFRKMIQGSGTVKIRVKTNSVPSANSSAVWASGR